MSTGSGWARLVIWAIIAVGSGYLATQYFLRWPTNNTIGKIFTIVMALLCISAILRIGNSMGWWSLIYSKSPR